MTTLDVQPQLALQQLIQGFQVTATYHEWDRPDAPARTASELVEGLSATWQTMQLALAHFTPPDLTQTLSGVRQGHTYSHQRGWVIWQRAGARPPPWRRDRLLTRHARPYCT